MAAKSPAIPLLRVILNNYRIPVNTQMITHNAHKPLIPLAANAFSLGHLVCLDSPYIDLEIGHFSPLTDISVSNGQKHGQSWVICDFP